MATNDKVRERIEAIIRMCGNARDNLRDGNVSAEGTLTAVTGGLESIKSVAGQALAALEDEAEPAAWAFEHEDGSVSLTSDPDTLRIWRDTMKRSVRALVYASPPSAAAQAEASPAGVDDLAAAIGTSEFMDPPDGGDVPLVEQVRRMARAYKQRGDDIVGLMAALDAEKAERREERAARMSFLGAAREALSMSGLTREQVIIADNAISEAFRRVREGARS